MKSIPLTKGYVAVVDDEDFNSLNHYKWTTFCTGNLVYAYRQAWPEAKNIFMHREILGLRDPKIKADHIDHNGLNNQRHNLRVCTCQQNNQNRQKTKGTSKYKGVYYNNHAKKWQATIRHNNKAKYLGLFDQEQEAALAYNNKAIILFGSFAVLNII